MFGQFVPLLVILGIMYFLVIAPQRKRQKQLTEMLSNLKNGDKVITVSGILGTVMGVNSKDNIIQLQIAPSVKIEITRNSIASLQLENGEK